MYRGHLHPSEGCQPETNPTHHNVHNAEMGTPMMTRVKKDMLLATEPEVCRRASCCRLLKNLLKVTAKFIAVWVIELQDRLNICCGLLFLRSAMSRR